jgi:hypothetical protein
LDIKQERQKWVELLSAVSQLEIKGESNIFVMFQIMTFIKNEIAEIDKKIKEQGG